MGKAREGKWKVRDVHVRMGRGRRTLQSSAACRIPASCWRRVMSSTNASDPLSSNHHIVMHPLPAHHSKHIPFLTYPVNGAVFTLAQVDDGKHNGTALWLGAQCLSAYLAATFSSLPRSRAQSPRPRAIELGSGIGLSACVFSLKSTRFLRFGSTSVWLSPLRAGTYVQQI